MFIVIWQHNFHGAERIWIDDIHLFRDDPRQLVDFKVSFTTLIDCKTISASEKKMLFLKSYLVGEARKSS